MTDLTQRFESRALLPCMLLLASACHSAPYVWVQQRTPESRAENAPTVVGPGDLIEVQVFGDEKMSTRGRVMPDGTLGLPVMGPVQVAGKDSTQLARMLEAELIRYVQVPQVTVIIHESLVSVSVLGEVRSAGVVDVVTPVTVLKALAKAGGLTEFACESCIYVLRTTAGKTERIRFDYDALIAGEPAATAFRLKTGDVLIVE